MCTELTKAQYKICSACLQILLAGRKPAGRKASQPVSIWLTCSICIAANVFKWSVKFAAVHQEVIEISSESRRDVQGAATGASCLDFRVPGGTRAGSKQVLPSQPALLTILPLFKSQLVCMLMTLISSLPFVPFLLQSCISAVLRTS